jgi:molecular chaperone GrpE (heat shock protein)
MSEPDNILDVDFDSQMRGLSQQAEQAIGKCSAADDAKRIDGVPRDDAKGAETDALGSQKLSGNGIAGDLRPVMNTLATVSKAAEEHATLLAKIERTTSADDAARQSLTKIVADLRALLEMKNGVSHSMFSALHDELKGYKDGFLLQSLHRPIIRDLLSLYDDMAEIHRQLSAAIVAGTRPDEASANAQPLIEQVRNMEMNIEHNVEFIVEVLARLDVVLLPHSAGKLDKCKQRAVAVEATDNPDDDTLVVRRIKQGFLWNDRVLRPEEVVIKKWKGSLRMPADPEPNTTPAPPQIV